MFCWSSEIKLKWRDTQHYRALNQGLAWIINEKIDRVKNPPSPFCRFSSSHTNLRRSEIDDDKFYD
jgi:hypothetical protein